MPEVPDHDQPPVGQDGQHGGALPRVGADGTHVGAQPAGAQAHRVPYHLEVVVFVDDADVAVLLGDAAVAQPRRGLVRHPVLVGPLHQDLVRRSRRVGEQVRSLLPQPVVRGQPYRPAVPVTHAVISSFAE